MYQTRNITFRCYVVHGDLVDRAAAKHGKTLSDYCRDVVIPWAASDLGEKVTTMPVLARGRHASMVNEAAKKRGLTREEFERLAVEQMAAKELGLPGPEDTKAPSGERPALRPGQYHIEEPMLTRPTAARLQAGRKR